jgi:hypothetical protein
MIQIIILFIEVLMHEPETRMKFIEMVFLLWIASLIIPKISKGG